MGRILVQHSHDIQFPQLLSALGTVFDTVEATDQDLAAAIEANQHEIDGLVLSHLTDAASHAADLLTNERFNAPTTPIAFVGKIGKDTIIPYGTRTFTSDSYNELISFMSEQRRISVLVVEDDDAIRDVLDISLTTYFMVDAVADGTQAMQRLKDSSYDIVVLDVMLPGISGEDVFAYIRESLPQTPVIIITAFDTKKRELEFTFHGADSYVPKPFDSNMEFRLQLMETLKARHLKSNVRVSSTQHDTAGNAWRNYERRMRSYT